MNYFESALFLGSFFFPPPRAGICDVREGAGTAAATQERTNAVCRKGFRPHSALELFTTWVSKPADLTQSVGPGCPWVWHTQTDTQWMPGHPSSVKAEPTSAAWWRKGSGSPAWRQSTILHRPTTEDDTHQHVQSAAPKNAALHHAKCPDLKHWCRLQLEHSLAPFQALMVGANLLSHGESFSSTNPVNAATVHGVGQPRAWLR